ncbi:unnamed protein product, partial [Amoebophrya sp. A25]
DINIVRREIVQNVTRSTKLRRLGFLPRITATVVLVCLFHACCALEEEKSVPVAINNALALAGKVRNYFGKPSEAQSHKKTVTEDEEPVLARKLDDMKKPTPASKKRDEVPQKAKSDKTKQTRKWLLLLAFT